MATFDFNVQVDGLQGLVNIREPSTGNFYTFTRDDTYTVIFDNGRKCLFTLEWDGVKSEFNLAQQYFNRLEENNLLLLL